jgi:NTE family protein
MNWFFWRKKRLGLVLGSGGARGIAHIPVLEMLNEIDMKPDYITGTSIGALLGAMYCSGRIDTVKKEFLRMNHGKILRYIDLVFNKPGLIGGKKVMGFLEKCIPANMKFKDLDIPLQVVATDYGTGEPVVLSEGNLLKAVRASISIPGIFTPVPYKKGFLIDGGLSNPLPVDVVRKMGATKVVAVNVIPPLEPKMKIKMGIAEVLMQSVQIYERGAMKYNMKDNPADILIEPKIPGMLPVDFSNPKKIYEEGEKEAKKYREELKKLR